MRLTFIGSGDAFSSGGRLNTCFHVAGEHTRFLIDCGATSLYGLNRAGVDCNAIDTVYITHFHADHFFGLPFLLIDACFASKRQRPLAIVGPEGLATRLDELLHLSYGGDTFEQLDFDLQLYEIQPASTLTVNGVGATAERMQHGNPDDVCLGYRFELDGLRVAYTGDTAWTDAIRTLGDEADLLISECCGYRTPIPSHLDFDRLKRELPGITAKRVILSHMGSEMLAQASDCEIEMAEDGLVIDL